MFDSTGGGVRILVEDDEVIRKAVAMALERYGCDAEREPTVGVLAELTDRT